MGPPEVAIFLQELVDAGLAGGTVAQAASAISWATQVADVPDPTKSSNIESVISTAKRIPREINRATPATIEHIQLLQQVATRKLTFVNKRTYALASTLFFSCSRVKDLIGVRRGAVECKELLIGIKTGKLKNDQYQRNAHSKYVAKSRNRTLCPYQTLVDWMADKGCKKDAAAPLFQGTRDRWVPLKKSAFRDNLRDAQQGSGLPLIQGHSFRSGMASLGTNIIQGQKVAKKL